MRDNFHLSYSQITTLMDCQARWKAEKLDGTWKFKPTKPMLVGSYVDALVYGDPDAWLDDHESEAWGSSVRYYKRDCATAKIGDEKPKLADFAKADEMFLALKNQRYVYDLLSEGGRQIEISGKIHGVEFLGVLDQKLNDGRGFVDLKTCASITELKWMETAMLHGKHPFYARYKVQFAIYGELLGWPEEMYIVAVSKESPPDVDVLRVEDVEALKETILELKPWVERAIEIRDGAEPHRCEQCEFCRTTKTVDKPRLIKLGS